MSYHGDLAMYIIDSFSAKPFGGNPAAVCLDPTREGLPTANLQAIAAEMNLSETGFVRKLAPTDQFDTASRFGLRWLTPTVEVVLCGHATLAAAATLFYCVGNKSNKLCFDTLSGTLTAQRSDSGITLDFPLDPPEPLQDKSEFSDLIKLIAPTDQVEDVQYGSHNKFLLVRLRDTTDRKNFENLPVQVERFKTAYNGDKLVAVIVTIKGGPSNGCVDDSGRSYDFVSRVFAPWSGIDEDPVTGAAHTILSAYWARELGKPNLYARQCSRRGGDLQIAVRDKDGHRVDISGRATVVLQGHITV